MFKRKELCLALVVTIVHWFCLTCLRNSVQVKYWRSYQVFSLQKLSSYQIFSYWRSYQVLKNTITCVYPTSADKLSDIKEGTATCSTGVSNKLCHHQSVITKLMSLPNFISQFMLLLKVSCVDCTSAKAGMLNDCVKKVKAIEQVVSKECVNSDLTMQMLVLACLTTNLTSTLLKIRNFQLEQGP